ncbi:hypothetical protein [Amycolatopsis dendrobii]|uniref:Uncharacterized protein n=1 Tax=Amycolatopsis dendrobii TaxID=2760662 RepID=A0A7W3Z957_9PSEU|nr:hypothetical protein [Amycolatopsis dendrobii]MBB1152517.1 hypothetical protein [Amycolatopsis dendrobii]
MLSASLDDAHTSGHFAMTGYPGGHFCLDRPARQLNESIIETSTMEGASRGRQ